MNGLASRLLVGSSLALAALSLAACDDGVASTSLGTPRGSGGGDGGTGSPSPSAPACPVDPDCSIGGDCSLYECPDYWVCETTASGGKRCTNPGPDYPDDGGGWTCEDVGGVTVCRGTRHPDGGGDGVWTCETQGEFVVCTDGTPSYPDGHGDGPWNCWFEGEFRVCESGTGDGGGDGGGGGAGDGGGWMCTDTASGRECRQNEPSYPDDREWMCFEEAGGTVVCSGRGDLPDGGGDGGWVCESYGEFVVCRDATPEYPDAGGDGAWDCRYEGEIRVCTDGGGGGDGGGTECVPGVQRWCDDATYCSWGKQTCLPEGRWGPCVEPMVEFGQPTDRPNTECACRHVFFDEDCCEDQMDRDGDGHADCIIPADHVAPMCSGFGFGF